MFHLEDMDFGRRLAMEKELEAAMVRAIGGGGRGAGRGVRG